MIFTELLPLNALSLETLTLVALDAVQPVGRVVLPSKSAQIIWPLSQPAPEELEELELLELEEELLELDEELLELDELELLELDDELLELDDELLELEELDDELPELDPLPPQAARAHEARIKGINFFM